MTRVRMTLPSVARSSWAGAWVVCALASLPLSGRSAAAAEQTLFPMENAHVAVVIDAADGATVRSFLHKDTGQELTFTDRGDGHLADFQVIDDWPNPVGGSYTFVPESRAPNGDQLVFRRTVPGWAATKTFVLPRDGTLLEVQLEIVNTGALPREIVPRVLDRLRLGNAGLDDDALIYYPESGSPVRTASFSENFWLVPGRGWFGVAGDREANALWLSVDYAQLNAILVQGPFHVSYPWRPNKPVLGWCYAPVVLAPQASWSTRYSYAFARGLPALNAASPDFAAHLAQQRFADAPRSVEIELASALTGPLDLRARFVTTTTAVAVDSLMIHARAGTVTPIALR